MPAKPHERQYAIGSLLALPLFFTGVHAAIAQDSRDDDAKRTIPSTSSLWVDKPDGRAHYRYGHSMADGSCNDFDMTFAAAENAVNETSPEQSVTTVASEDDTLKFHPISTHIVSPGEHVIVQIKPQYQDASELIVSVDRLPHNAYLHDNQDGSHSFSWQTSGSDEGEHRFRFTAKLATNKGIQSMQSALIIIGDPTKSSSFPAN